MDNELSRCFLQNNFFKLKLFDWKVLKIDDVIGLSLNHVFSSNNGYKYDISINFIVFVNTNK